MTLFSRFTAMTLAPSFTLTRRKLALTGLGLSLGLAGCGPTRGNGSSSSGDGKSVTLDTARTELEAGRAVLIDIREPEEHATGVAAGARLLPMSQLGARLAEFPTATDKPVLLICNTQNRSSATIEALRERGYADVRYVKEGMSEWVRRGWPVVKPEAR